ncbi:cytochrome P450 98A2-like [Syzygium oleosum]|uniref:cytochrome P450 98A2-like n=1 Tax=Syzygium oleosum TaxID=219896 RepID=UPI0024B92CFB|nr:cytochrome P450 98A2-like [Syzygium oleosum]
MSYEPFILIISIFLAIKLCQWRKPTLPPGPYPFPLIGNLHQIKPNVATARCFAEWSWLYGPVMSVWLGSKLSIVVSSPELAKEVLKDHDQVLANRHRMESTVKITKDGKGLVWADYGPHYVKLRKICVHELFSARRIEALRPIREDEVRNMVETICRDCTGNEGQGRSLVVRKYLSSVAFNCISRLVFGKKFVTTAGEATEQGSEFKEIVAEGNRRGASLSLFVSEHVRWFGWVFRPDQEELRRHVARRDRLVRAIIGEGRLKAEQGRAAEQHFVDALLGMQESYDLSEETVIELLWDMITAGMDTIAISVEWAMAELIKNPRTQRKVQEELDRVVGLGLWMTESDLSNLPYLQCVVKEALRLHPPTPLMLPHKASANTKIGHHDIPKGTIVSINLWAMGRDPDLWQDPLKFRPDRFREDNIDVKGQDFRLLPFGSGRRVCPAAQLSLNLVASMLCQLLHHFSWAGGEEIDMTESPGLVCYMQKPLQAIPTMRLPANLYDKSC